jgi:hypothetical protein
LRNSLLRIHVASRRGKLVAWRPHRYPDPDVGLSAFSTSSSMRRLFFALLLPLLLIAQQGAFVHSLEHLPGAAAPSSAQDHRQAPGDQYCEKCFTFAQIGSAADLPTLLAAALGSEFDAIGFGLPVAPALQVRIPRSRGPPSFL